ncbi:MAG: ECF transporter S component [Ruminococcaceae bacterium]|nr:ECF transporter S component [Oscillospiraceae bacterium]
MNQKPRSDVLLYRIVLSGLFLALALIFPFLTGQIKTFGNMLLPMHIPIFLCGFICGAPCGAAVGFAAPLLRSLMFGMPALFPTAVAMAIELCVYGAVSGAMYRALPKRLPYLYLSLFSAMLVGRAVWGLASILLYRLAGSEFSWSLFLGGALIHAVPGIVIQFIIVPLLVRLANKLKIIR